MSVSLATSLLLASCYGSDDADAGDGGMTLDGRVPLDTGPPVDCFVAGTSIATPAGDVPIERLRVGDRVWSYDEANERRVAAQVVRTFRHASSTVHPLRLADGRVLHVTAEHPIYVATDAEYLPAGATDGQLVLGLDGERVRVSAIGPPRTVDFTYNLEVAGHHNYFAAGVLVHNKTDIPPPRPDPTTCECCGTTVTLGRGDVCPSDVCDPYCAGCVAAPIDVMCFVDPAEDTPFTVDIVASECTCSTSLECVVGVDELNGVIDLNVAACSDPDVICTECARAEGSCSIPALDRGIWRVRVSGQREFLMQVRGRVDPHTICLTSTAEPVADCSYGEDSDFGWEEYCVPSEAPAGERVPITVTSCAPCGELGTCYVSFDDASGVLFVSPAARAPICEVTCPDECEPRVDTCFTPPLEPRTYQLSISGNESTIEINVDPNPTEICNPR